VDRSRATPIAHLRLDCCAANRSARGQERVASATAAPMGAARNLLGLCCLAVAAGADTNKSSTEECAKLGFAPTLLCSACTKLGEAVGPTDALVEECTGCCTEDVSGSSGTYAKATLDICR
jgi:hypothetical protein